MKRIMGIFALLILTVVGITGCKHDRDRSQGIVEYEVEADGCSVKAIDNPRGPNFFIAKCPAASDTVTYQHKNGKTYTAIPTVTTREVEDLEQRLSEAKVKQSALDKLTVDEKKALGIK